jgi:hypothetical protein
MAFAHANMAGCKTLQIPPCPFLSHRLLRLPCDSCRSKEDQETMALGALPREQGTASQFHRTRALAVEERPGLGDRRRRSTPAAAPPVLGAPRRRAAQLRRGGAGRQRGRTRAGAEWGSRNSQEVLHGGILRLERFAGVAHRGVEGPCAARHHSQPTGERFLPNFTQLVVPSKRLNTRVVR